MDKVLYSLANLSPIFLTLFFFLYFYSIKEELVLGIQVLYGIILGLYTVFCLLLLVRGYGNIVMVSITQGLILLYCIIIWCRIIYEYRMVKVIILVSCMLVSVMCYCVRLELEGILQLDFADKIIDFILNFNFKVFFTKIIKNKWFSEISITVIGTVLGGLILNKIISKKKTKDVEDKDFEDKDKEM